MCTNNTISSHTDHFEIQKRDSEESLAAHWDVEPQNKQKTLLNNDVFLSLKNVLIFANSAGSTLFAKVPI